MTASFFIQWGDNVSLTRDFYYNQKLILNVYTNEMFYLTNEFPPVFSIEVANRTDTTITSELSGNIKINDKKKKRYLIRVSISDR